MNSSQNDSFVNINLEESMILPKENISNENEHDVEDESFSNDEDKVIENNEKTENYVKNEKLDKIVDKTFEDFSEFFKITPQKQVIFSMILEVLCFINISPL